MRRPSLTFSLSAADVKRSAPELLDVAFQTPDGFWQVWDELSAASVALAGSFFTVRGSKTIAAVTQDGRAFTFTTVER